MIIFDKNIENWESFVTTDPILKRWGTSFDNEISSAIKSLLLQEQLHLLRCLLLLRYFTQQDPLKTKTFICAEISMITFYTDKDSLIKMSIWRGIPVCWGISKSFCRNRPYSMGSLVFCDISLATTMMVCSGRQILLKGNPVQMCLPCSIRQCRKVCVPIGATMCASTQTTKVKVLYCYCWNDPLMTVTFLHNDKPLSLLKKLDYTFYWEASLMDWIIY